METAIQKYKDIDAWKENPILEREAFDKLQLVMTEAGELDTNLIVPYEKLVTNEILNQI